MVGVEDTNALVRFEGLSRYDTLSGRVFFKSFSQAIYPNDRILLDGASGAGKSVFLRTLAFLDQMQEGVIYFKNEAITPKNVTYYRSQVAYVHQQAILFEGTVEENIHLPWQLKIHQGKVFDQSLLMTYLSCLEKPADFLKKSSKTLSGGEQQICHLLRTLMLNPSVLLLDEPTSALDAEAVILVENLLNHWCHQDKAWVWVSHDQGQKQRVGQQQWRIDQATITVGNNI
ncbi:ABC transporter ATP-binding protein [Pelistega ratti]|uniref:ABC transporter ATP-binding protein n=1 Tax=Pelistega ratti TaxID=2652177 RepID=UPI0013588190|nr:ATP-binding cassette domain-containing protein [Pelistega ratti]